MNSKKIKSAISSIFASVLLFVGLFCTSISPAYALTECVGADIEAGKVCAELPFVGQECVSVPGLPKVGTADVCVTPYVIPPHAEVCIKVDGHTVGCESIGL